MLPHETWSVPRGRSKGPGTPGSRAATITHSSALRSGDLVTDNFCEPGRNRPSHNTVSRRCPVDVPPYEVLLPVGLCREQSTVISFRSPDGDGAVGGSSAGVAEGNEDGSCPHHSPRPLCQSGKTRREGSSTSGHRCEADYSPPGGGGQAKSGGLGGLAVAQGASMSRPSSSTGHAHDIVDGRRRLGLLRRAEAQVIENLLDGDGVVEVGHDLELPPALATRERVGMEDLRDEARPVALQRRLLAGSVSTLASPGSSTARSPRTRLA